MDKKKEIKIDPSFFSYSSSAGKGTTKKKREKKNVSKKELINVKDKDVKELLLQKLKEYKKKKNKEKTNIQVNDLKRNVNKDFLQKIKQKRNKTENNILNDGFNENIIDLNENISSFQSIQPTSTNNILQNTEIPSVSQKLVIKQNDVPEYGILKNSSKPTFREYINQNSIISQQQHNFPKVKKNKKKEEKIQLEVEKKYLCGKNKTKKKIGIFIKNNKLRRVNEEKKFEIKKTNFKTVKNYLKKNNLIKYGCSAPSDLLREIYENSKLCGDINNINGNSLVHNYINNEE